jgi:hypothetical protein
MRVTAWTAGALAVGWLGTAASALAYPVGHPPMWFVTGEGVILASFVLAPLGAGAALVDLWRARRQAVRAPRGTVAALGLNLLFLSVALALWLWILWAAARR